MKRRQVLAGGTAVLLAGVGYYVYRRDVIEIRISNTHRDPIALGVTVREGEEILFEESYELASDTMVSEKLRVRGDGSYFVEAESHPEESWGYRRSREIRSNTSEIHVEYSISRLTVIDPANRKIAAAS